MCYFTTAGSWPFRFYCHVIAVLLQYWITFLLYMLISGNLVKLDIIVGAGEGI